MAQVENNKKYGYVNRQGKQVVPPELDNANWFYNDVAAVQKNGKWGLMNKQGKYIIKPEYRDIGFFHEGLADLMQSIFFQKEHVQ
jgi:hypothetical protein